MAFVYVQPHMGDKLTNLLNSLLWQDPSNCCFGPYLAAKPMTLVNGTSTMLGSAVDGLVEFCGSCPNSYTV